MSLRGCKKLANERPRIRHAQESESWRAILTQSLVAGAGKLVKVDTLPNPRRVL